MMTRVRGSTAESRVDSGWLKQRFLGFSGFAALVAVTLVLATMLFVGPTGPAKAACAAAGGNVENCTDAPPADISYTAPGTTTLNVNTLTIDPSRISLTGTGA